MDKPRKRSQVLLLYPKTGMDFGSTVAPPHNLLAVAAPLVKAGYSVRILDQRVGQITEEVLKGELSDDTICVGISSMVGSQIFFALSLAKTVRRLTGGKVPIVWGGCQPTVVPEHFADNEYVDYVVMGEGDLTLLDMVNAWQSKASLEKIPGIIIKNGGKPVRTAPRALLDVETLLPVPWELVNVEDYVHRDMYIGERDRVLDIGQTSRGCPFQCSFCSSAAIRQRKWRAMSPDKSIDMIVGAVKKYKLNGFWLRDDEFYIDRKRADDIFKGIIRSGIDVRFYTSGTRCDVFAKATEEEVAVMRQAGCHTLKFGAESGSQRILDLIQKGIKVEQTIEANLKCKRHGIIPAFSMMAGFPTETFEDINKTIDLMSRLKKDNESARFETIAMFTALPGTTSWSLAVEHGLKPPQRLEDWVDWLFDDYDFNGRKTPWFKRQKERIWLGNISFMCTMGNSLPHLVSSARNPVLRACLNIILKPLTFYYRFMLAHKKYRFMPDLLLVHHIRKKLFHKKLCTVK